MFKRLGDKIVQRQMQIYERRTKKVHSKYKKYSKKCQERAKELAELETEYGKERAWQEKYIKYKAYWAICIGVFMLLLTMAISYMCEISEWGDDTKALWGALISILNSVFSIIIGIFTQTFSHSCG